jgi:hypothetical protein
LSASPSRTIRSTPKRPVENTTKFGAVATGSIKAQLALIAAGTINNRGSIPTAMAAAASIGINNKVVAVLLVISVMNVTDRQIAIRIASGCQLDKTDTA